MTRRRTVASCPAGTEARRAKRRLRMWSKTYAGVKGYGGRQGPRKQVGSGGAQLPPDKK